MKTLINRLPLMAAASLFACAAVAGPLDPDCTAEKAAKSAAAKATVGVGGRCSAGEAVKDTTKGAVGADEKGVLEKRRDDPDPKDKAKQAAKRVVD